MSVWIEVENRDEDTKAIEVAFDGEVPADWRAELSRQIKTKRGVVVLTFGSKLDEGHADPAVPLPRFSVPEDLWIAAKKSRVVQGWLAKRNLTESGQRMR